MRVEYGCTKEFTEEILNSGRKVFDITKLVSNDKTEATLIVLFENGDKKVGTFKNNYSVKRNYTLLRKECLGVTI